MVGVAWIGFDQPKTLGANETGANAALPIWISYMAKALKGTHEANLPMPEGIRRRADQCRIRASRRHGGPSPNTFSPNFRRAAATTASIPSKSGKDIRDQLF